MSNSKRFQAIAFADLFFNSTSEPRNIWFTFESLFPNWGVPVNAVVVFIVLRYQNTSLVWKTKVDKEKQSVIS